WRLTVMDDANPLAQSTKHIAGRACSPRRLEIKTLAEAVGKLSPPPGLSVGLFQQRADVVGGLGLTQETAEGLVSQAVEDDLHRAQVRLGVVLGREQEED